MTRRNRSQYDVRTYLGTELYERVLREAAARRLNLSECVRNDLLQFYDLRDELASALRVERGDRRTGQRILDTLLDPMEERIAASIGIQATALSDLREQLRRFEWMIDRHYPGLMLHLPDVAEDLRDERSSSATARHRAWKRDVDTGPSVPGELPSSRRPADEAQAPSAAGRGSDGDGARRTRGSPTFAGACELLTIGRPAYREHEHRGPAGTARRDAPRPNAPPAHFWHVDPVACQEFLRESGQF